MIKEITASLFADMVASGANNLANNKQAIDALNVFPVPDGDTGTNMSMTMLNAAKGLSQEFQTAEEVTGFVASATLRGARGNSGVILSQIFRGIATASKTKKTLTAADFAVALKKGADSAYRAVMKPTEGTILTVIRACADAANSMDEEDVEALLTLVCQKGNEALDLTPTQLPMLAQAGVVDAGGKGLMTILEGMLTRLSDGAVIERAEKEPEEKVQSAQEKISAADIRFAYCTEFIIQKKNAAVRTDLFREAIEKKGDSMVVIDDDDIIKVHIHSNHPGFILEQAVKLGQLTKIKIENMREQHSSIIEKEAAPKEEPEKEEAVIQAPPKEFALIAVAAGKGVSGLFTDLGAAVISGGQTMNPSTEDLLNAVKEQNAECVYILPNNKNIIMAANQAASLAKCRVVVIPTKTIPQGVAAIMSFNPAASAQENEEQMSAAISVVKTGQITYSVRDTVVGDQKIAEGDVLGILEKEIVKTGTDRAEVTQQLLDMMIDEETSVVTIIYGEDATEEEAQALAEYVENNHDGCDVSVYGGDQPVYAYILSAE